MNIKLERPLAFFDLETTGTDINKDKIVEIAVCKLFPDGRVEEKSRRLNPGIPIPYSASAIHGIFDADVKNEPSFCNFSKSLLEYLSGCDLGGYNCIRFDVPILAREFHECNLSFPEKDVKVLDVQRIFHSKEPRNLKAALKFYCDKDLNKAHNALADTSATLEVFLSQLNRYEDLGNNLTDIVRQFSAKDENLVDMDGKLIKSEEGEILFNFGKHKGKRVKDELDYATWMISADFHFHTKEQLKIVLDECGKLSF